MCKGGNGFSLCSELGECLKVTIHCSFLLYMTFCVNIALRLMSQSTYTVLSISVTVIVCVCTAQKRLMKEENYVCVCMCFFW